jgi:hypothetical protein
LADKNIKEKHVELLAAMYLQKNRYVKLLAACTFHICFSEGTYGSE